MAAGVIEHIVAVTEPDDQHHERPADLVAPHRQEKVAAGETERLQRLKLDDRPVFHVAGAAIERL